MAVQPGNFLIGLVLSLLIGGLGYRSNALAPSGVIGAVVVGTLIFGGGGWVWGVLLILFFVSSSLLSRYRERDKLVLSEKFAKLGRRDLGQALANGGWGALLALAYALQPDPLLFPAFVGAMATVNADTWATELGVLSRGRPRRITTGEPVPPGTSGAVSTLGTAAALAGALLIGLAAQGLHLISRGGSGVGTAAWVFWLPLIAGIGGLTGSLFDSLLGGTVQGIYWCATCNSETERTLHGCGTATSLLRGWRWLDNDAVNFLSSVVGSGVTILLILLVQQLL